MKRALLSFFLVALVYPVFSQNFSSKTERKHTTQSARFKKTTETPDKQEKFLSFMNIGAMGLKNSAQADSIMVSAYDLKGSSWSPLSKEYPKYHSQSAFIDELESWYFTGNDYEPGIKYIAGYDDQNQLTRIEVYTYDNGAWVPMFAEESITGNWGEEIFFAEYYFNTVANDWEIMYGYRAVDKLNNNGALVERLWEYFDYDEWVPEYLEEYTLNEQDVIIEIIEYYYDDWDNTWEKDFRMVLELCENNMWQHGYAYFWDWDEESWVPELKYESFDWFDFDQMLYSKLVVMANADEFDDWYDWKTHDDIDWINYMRITIEYTDNGKMTMMLYELWADFLWKEDWLPFMKMETEYDHLSNIVYDTFGMFDDDDWMVFGMKLDMEYHSDGSIKEFTFNFIASDWDDYYWKYELMPLLHYRFNYSDDPTDVLLVQKTASELLVFPNPATNFIQLQLPDVKGGVNISIMGIDGRVVANYNQVNVSAGQTVTFDVSGLKSGFYLVMVSDSVMKHSTRFVKR